MVPLFTKLNVRMVAFVVTMILVAIALSACQTTGDIDTRSVKPLPNFCEVQVAYTPPEQELQHVAKAPYTVDYLLKINRYGADICGWKETRK